MILYHGSYLEIAKPDLSHSRSNVDFGRGFYVTPLHEQAAKWCGKFKRRGKDGIISRYTFDESREAELKTLKFDSREQRAKWACLHAHLATAARVTYPAALQRCKLDAPLLAAGLLTPILRIGWILF